MSVHIIIAPGNPISFDTSLVMSRHNELIKSISIFQTLFSRASLFLFNSTKNSLYFKEVTIVVPPTWSSHPDYEVLPGNFFSNAHVRIDLPNPEFKDTPYTLQPGSCGEQGQYIHLTPWFLKELNGETVEMFGAPGECLPFTLSKAVGSILAKGLKNGPLKG